MSRGTRHDATNTHIPFELLAKIFVHTLDDVEWIHFPHQRSESPWTLRSVCSRWREVSLAEPRLWSKMSIYATVRHSLSDLLPILAILPSSGPLSIALETSNYRLDNYDGLIETFVKPYLPRLKKLHLRVPESTLSKLWQLEPTAHAHIQDLALHIRHPDRHWNTASPLVSMFQTLKVFGPAGGLRKLAFTTTQGDIRRAFLTSPNLPWDQLTHLNLLMSREPLDVRDVCGLLERCPSLIEFAVSVEGRASSEKDILLYELTSVTIHCHDIGTSLHLPLPWHQLTELTMSVGNANSSLLSILQMTSSLISLSIEIYTEYSPGSVNDPLLLFALESLTLCTECAPVLPCLRLPLLDHLGITPSRSIRPTEHIPATIVHDLITRSQCTLRSFEYSCKTPYPYLKPETAALDVLLADLHALQKLITPYLHLDHLLRERIEGKTVLPNLTVLETRVTDPADFADLIERRIQSQGNRLRAARGHCHSSSPSVLESIDEAESRLDRINRSLSTDFRFQNMQRMAAHSDDLMIEIRQWL